MEIWSRAAFRALEECRTAMEARKASERLEGSEKIQKEPGAAPERQQAPGSHATTGGGLGGDHTAQRGRRSGLGLNAGEVFSDEEFAPMHSPATNADLYRCDFTSAGPGAFQQGDGDARWNGKRRNAAGARLGGAGSSSLLPAVLIAQNDNRHLPALRIILSSGESGKRLVSDGGS